MNTTVITRPSALLHANADHIKRLFAAVLAHTATPGPDSDDYVLPALTQVHIEVLQGNLRLICSDRFSMGIVTVPMTSTSDGFATSFAVTAEEVRVALMRMDGAQATVIVEANALRITADESSEEITGVRSDLPWRSALERILTPNPTPTGAIALDPKLLARLQEAKPLAPDEPMLLRLGGEKGAVVATLGATFLGLVMPINMQSAARHGLIPKKPLDGWFDLLDEEPVIARAAGNAGAVNR